MTHQLSSSLTKASACGTGILATMYAPALIATAGCVALALLTVLALTGTFAKSDARRNAAYKTLKLLLGPRRRPPAAPPHR